jgi:hypothetical protein
MKKKIICLIALFILSFGMPLATVHAASSDDQIRQQIVQASVNAYLATGHPCACPYNTMRNGRACGGRSAYSRPGGAAPLCYPKDVTDAQVAQWRRQKNAAK